MKHILCYYRVVIAAERAPAADVPSARTAISRPKANCTEQNWACKKEQIVAVAGAHIGADSPWKILQVGAPISQNQSIMNVFNRIKCMIIGSIVIPKEHSRSRLVLTTVIHGRQLRKQIAVNHFNHICYLIEISLLSYTRRCITPWLRQRTYLGLYKYI